VLVRVLKGNDFAIKGGSDGFEVIVLSRGSSTTTSPAITATIARSFIPRERVRADPRRVRASVASVAKIVATLGEHIPVHYRVTRESGGVTENFGGPLRRVLVRVLKGDDFVIKGGSDGFDVIVLSRGSSTTTSPAFTATIGPSFIPK